MHGLIFHTQNRIKVVLNCINKMEMCGCVDSCCEKCKPLKRNTISYSSTLATTYGKLMSWLVRIPFTRLKPFEKFREEINNEMKSYLKIFRRKPNDNLLKEAKTKVKKMTCLEKNFFANSLKIFQSLAEFNVGYLQEYFGLL